MSGLRRILVTGGNAGIGFGLCRQLAGEEGCHVFLCSRDASKGAAAVTDIKAKHPDAAIELVEVDVGSDDSVAKAAAAVEQSLAGEKLYGIVNNAGVGLAATADMETVLNTNYRGPLRIFQAFKPMLQAEGARIVNVGSGAGPSYVNKAPMELKKILTSPTPTLEQIEHVLSVGLDHIPEADRNGFPPYGLSKACLASHTILLASEHPSITWSCCSPGFIDTKLTAGFGARLTPEDVVVIKHCLFQPLKGNGFYYGSDAVRSPYHFMRNPGEPEFDGTNPFP